MKLILNKKNLKQLNNDKSLAMNATPQVAGGAFTDNKAVCVPTNHCAWLNTDAFFGCPTGPGYCFSSPQEACVDTRI
ncbi:hypothetical protein [Pseudoalteromonas phenolica]|uniref:Uncharacterized protein n=1 Tax=Pseudoalteromonas phenolica TaxID=161398 RepID=A0A0S2K0Q0_9GAMM|nr:hypothetical protein [Pseudoalteromonas phenolica]ALO41637.1 hypothetical protein PP2015_1121 [Pseudoalteromonas phenolica]MBE0353813.1 hypothetical protein [Pseudoalteromonas phenolica O-BC30]RXE91757.1 hypothetical protein D9981_22210 [Pseudoalteromonas phenolica O-BC30]